MAEGYGSRTRSLSPGSPALSNSPTFVRNFWKPHHGQSNGGVGNSPSSNRKWQAVRDDVINNAMKMQRRLVRIYQKMSILQRVLAVVVLVVNIVVVSLFFIYNQRFFSFLKPYAISWKRTTGGWTILWGLIFLAAFPPMIGYSTFGTLAGFVYGLPEGWLILASATVVGSTCSFLVSRYVLRSYAERLVASDKRFAALTLTLKHDGLKLLVLIRLCPLPYSLVNGAVSTFPTVHPLMYGLATAITSPKAMINVFIGSRLGAIGEDGEQMGTGAKAVNWLSIIISALVGAGTGWYIYQRTMARARQLEAEENANVQHPVTHTRRHQAEFLDDPEAQAASAILVQDDDHVDLFNEASGASEDRYRDEPTDDDDDGGGGGGGVFNQIDGEEDAIDMHRQDRR